MSLSTVVDQYIDEASEDAKPILEELRRIIHLACPACEESIKWKMPNLANKGMICSMAAFKHHCSFTFFKADMMKDPHQLLSKVGKSSMGHIGKLKTQQKRLASAIEWIKEGNPRNWKYMKRL